MSNQVSDFLVDRISQWGINRIYGYPALLKGDPEGASVIKQTFQDAKEEITSQKEN